MTGAPHTVVLLRRVPRRRRDRFRFAEPVAWRSLDPHTHVAAFAPGATFCLVQWRGNAFGTCRWRLVIAQAGDGAAPVQALSCIHPGADSLAFFVGTERVRRALVALRLTEMSAGDLTRVRPDFWRRFQERVSLNLPLGPLPKSADR